MLSREKKIKLVEELAEILKNNPSLLFVDFSGLNMGELITLKKDLKKENIKFKALKKSLLGFAFKKSGREEFSAQGGSASGGDTQFGLSGHKGAVAIIYSANESDAAIATVVNSFIVKNKKGAILGGYLLGEKMLKDAVVALAQLPERNVLLSQVLQLMMSPVSGFVRVLDEINKRQKVAL